ncbi:GNAT family N-acetyltransferase [Nocardia brasiliensis]|uniref:GNAT family N-acetyltransferase n=1 Tax=Nocardia brasiliensis TaxID=37326 RepID=A0A6G9XMQ2_NOCBR|nr:GNAT family N-acetyltransferase [Nocardia brasiliensis]QIS02186.1 GNAT family N-acetyltransferase [Nocardia brasiliensis]
MEITIVDIAPGQPEMAAVVAPLIQALRPDLGVGFSEFAEEGHRQGLVFTGAFDPQGHCLGVATHRVLATSRGRLLFIDDLITAPEARSRGVGARLLTEMEHRARAAGCVRIELDSGVTNVGAHRFYHGQGMSIMAFHFARSVDG